MSLFVHVTIKSWYSVGKTIAEKEAFSYAKSSGLNIVTLCASIIIGPMLQSTLNASCLFLLDYMTGLYCIAYAVSLFFFFISKLLITKTSV